MGQNIDINKRDDSQNRGSSGRSLIDYTLTIFEDEDLDCPKVQFVLLKQSPLVTKFLEKVGTWRASNGIGIQLGLLFPEWKESENIIRLAAHGCNNLGRPDTTSFTNDPKLKAQQVRNKVANFKLALEELGAAVKAANNLRNEFQEPKVERIVIK